MSNRVLKSALWIGTAIGAVWLLGIHDASAQSIERNLPPAPRATAPLIVPPNIGPTDQDTTPLGPALAGIVVLGNLDPILQTPPAGIDVSRAPKLRDDRAALSQFLGKPMSRRLIGQIEAQIAKYYRDSGFAFVNLATPQQEITSGVLQIRAMEFHLGSKKATGVDPSEAAYIESRVRVKPPDAVDTNLLAQDLDWLNRFPFRKAEAAFTPAPTVGDTDLLLNTTAVKPWGVYAGYANSGSPLTGMDRYFAGAQAAIPGLHDAFASYQFTGSSDVFADHGRIFDSAEDPRYMSHAGRLYIPTFARQDVEISLDYVQTNQPVQAFFSHQVVWEANIAYRSALSNVFAALPGEALLGVEAKRDDQRTTFGGTTVARAGFDVFQILLGYSYQGSDALGRTVLDINLHISPGGIDDRNTDARFSAFSKGDLNDARYAYLGGDLTRYTLLPDFWGWSGFALVDSLVGQYSSAALPQTEQSGIGGESLVRGYTLDDGAFDSAIISRNELRVPSFTLSDIGDATSPYVFFDAGYGHDQSSHKSAHPCSAGLGVDVQLGTHLSASVNGGWALRDVGFTRAGNVRLESRLTLTF